MLTIAFIPHHHHRHTICLQDICDNKQHHDNSNTCCVRYITYFQSQQQQNHEKIFFYGLYGAFPYNPIDLIPGLYEFHSFQTIIDHFCCFLTQWKRVTRGLRAPPFIV